MVNFNQHFYLDKVLHILNPIEKRKKKHLRFGSADTLWRFSADVAVWNADFSFLSAGVNVNGVEMLARSKQAPTNTRNRPAFMFCVPTFSPGLDEWKQLVVWRHYQN